MTMGGVTIDTVTARYPAHIGATAARRLLHVLEHSDVAPSGLAPHSILIVRSVVASAPLSLAAWYARPDFERGVRDVVADYQRRAARPDRGRIRHNTVAVLFTDEAEMLACLARDLLYGEAWGRWWWRTVLGSAPAMSISSMLTTLFCRQARAVPGALSHLAAWGDAGTVMQALTPQQAQEVFAALCSAYGLAILTGQGKRSSVTAFGHGQHDAASSEAQPPAAPSPRTGSAGLLPPWDAWVPHASVPLGMIWERSCLLGVALALQRAPSLARSNEFVAALIEWRTANQDWKNQDWKNQDWKNQDRRNTATGVETAATDGKTVPRVRKSGDAATHPAPTPVSVLLSEQRATTPDATDELFQPSSEGSGDALEASGRAIGEREPAEQSARLKTGAPAPDTALPAQTPGQSDTAKLGHLIAVPGTEAPMQTTVRLEAAEPAQQSVASKTEARAPAAPDGPDIAMPHSTHPATGEVAATEPTSTVESSQQATLARDRNRDNSNIVRDTEMPISPSLTPATLANGVVTRLSGILYLINLMRHYDLPTSFEEEWQLAGRLGAWGVLEALARGLLALDASVLETDPIWQALAMLSGRAPGTRLGAALPATSRFHLPPTWLEERSDDHRSPLTIHWAADSKRLRLWSDNGYLLAETPRIALSEELHAQSVLDAYPTLAARAELVHSPMRAAPIRLPRMLLLRELAPALARWLGRALPFLQQRLRWALHQAGEADDPVSSLLRAPGRLYITAMHVDLVMPLDAISVPARIAGLDRDPGWMPDFGRVILFHFE